jgi:sugar/nucleoside kinase (ribokinase family)
VARAFVAGHIVLDTIATPSETYESLGGPPLYAGLYLVRMSIDPFIRTRYGPDLGDERLEWIERSGLVLEDLSSSASPCTRFRIQLHQWLTERQLFLLSRCDDLREGELQSDFDLGLIVPVIHELSPSLISEARRSCRYLYVDPQGFLRKVTNGRVVLSSNSSLVEELRHVDAMKVDQEEGEALTGADSVSTFSSVLHRRGVKELIVTEGTIATRLYTEDAEYRLPIKPVITADGVGMGDILGAAYSSARLKEEPSFSLCLAVAAATARAERKAIDKVPFRKEVEALAERLAERLTKVS